MKHIPPDALCRADSRTSTVSAFREELLKREPALRKYARKLGAADLADDLVQETLSRALGHEAAYSAQGLMTAWLKQVMRNVAHDQRKRRRRYDLFCDLAPEAADDESDREAEDYASAIADETTLPGKRETQLDAKNLIELAAKIIGAEMWKCLERTATGHTSDEIAAELGISAVAVRQNISRGRKAMAALRADPKHKVSKPIRKKSR